MVSTYYGIVAVSRRRTRLVIAVSLAVFLVLVASLLFLKGTVNKSNTSSTADALTSSGHTVTPEAYLGQPGATVSGLKAGSDFYFISSPGGSLPASKKDGPTVVSGGLNEQVSGFSHNESGAVFAAVHLGERSSSMYPPSVFLPVQEKQMVGIGKTDLLTETRTEYELLRKSANLPVSAYIRDKRTDAYVGYHVSEYTDDFAIIELLKKAVCCEPELSEISDSERYFTVSIGLRWQETDWVLNAPSYGSLSPVLPVDNISAFTIFNTSEVSK